METMLSERGKKLVIVKKYTFRKDRETTLGVSYRCTKRGCVASISVDKSEEVILMEKGSHNHPFDEKLQVKDNMIKRVINVNSEECPTPKSSHLKSLDFPTTPTPTLGDNQNDQVENINPNLAHSSTGTSYSVYIIEEHTSNCIYIIEGDAGNNSQICTTIQEIDNVSPCVRLSMNDTRESRDSITRNQSSTNRQVEPNLVLNSQVSTISTLDTMSERINIPSRKEDSFIFVNSDFTSSIGPPPPYDPNSYEPTPNQFEPPPHYSVIVGGRSSIDSIPVHPQESGNDSFQVKASRFLLLTLTVIVVICIIRLIK